MSSVRFLLLLGITFTTLVIPGFCWDGTFENGADTGNSLLCSGNAHDTDTYLWSDIGRTPSINIFLVNKDGKTKTEEAKEESKYDNFFIQSSYFPEATVLELVNIALEDSGLYKCELLVDAIDVDSFRVRVEVPPLYMLLACSDIDVCPPPPPDLDPSRVDCTCTAVGVFPSTLQLIGNNEESPHSDVARSLIGQDGTYDISSDFIVFPTAANNEFTCEIDGYENDIEESETYLFRAPQCELLIDTDQTCSTANLTCVCYNGLPGVTIYSFYDENKDVIGTPEVTDQLEVEISSDTTMYFYCRGCNGVNFGAHSFADNSVLCAVPESSTRTGMSTSQKLFIVGMAAVVKAVGLY